MAKNGRKSRKSGDRSDAEAFMKHLEAGDNVKAKQALESILRRKVAQRIKDTLAS